jgi:hypothetical protein
MARAMSEVAMTERENSMTERVAMTAGAAIHSGAHCAATASLPCLYRHCSCPCLSSPLSHALHPWGGATSL